MRSIWADDSSSLSISGDRCSTAPTFVVTYDEMAQFEISYASREITVSSLDEDLSDNTIEHLLVDQIWPRLLANDGELVLHAAGVSGPQGAVLFVGQSGRGKSTLAASLHQRGFALLGDDAIVTFVSEGEARCSAVYRSLRLFPDSIATLFEQPVRQSEVADYTDKQNVHLPPPPPEERAGQPRVEAIFFINPDEAHAGASVARVMPGDACMRLVEHSFWLDPTDMSLTTRKLQSASALAAAVPSYQLDYPRDFSKLAELHTAILAVLANNRLPAASI